MDDIKNFLDKLQRKLTAEEHVRGLLRLSEDANGHKRENADAFVIALANLYQLKKKRRADHARIIIFVEKYLMQQTIIMPEKCTWRVCWVFNVHEFSEKLAVQVSPYSTTQGLSIRIRVCRALRVC